MSIEILPSSFQRDRLKVVVALRLLLAAISNSLDRSNFMINVKSGWFEKIDGQPPGQRPCPNLTVDGNASGVSGFGERSDRLNFAGKERCRNDLADNRI
jgi:hypothetical protein